MIVKTKVTDIKLLDYKWKHIRSTYYLQILNDVAKFNKM